LATEPLIIRRFEPDAERCLRALARFLGIAHDPLAPIPASVALSVTIPTGGHSITMRRRRGTAASPRLRQRKESAITAKESRKYEEP
jgi:hypothetical protein